MEFDNAYNKHDAAAIAALFTPDAVEVWAWEADSTVSGQQAIEKRYAVDAAAGMNNHVIKLVQAYPIGSEVCAIMKWSVSRWKGYAVSIYVRDADTWKIRASYDISSMIPW